MFSSFQTSGRSRSGSCMMQAAPGVIMEFDATRWTSERKVQTLQATKYAVPDVALHMDPPAKQCRMQESTQPKKRVSRAKTGGLRGKILATR